MKLPEAPTASAQGAVWEMLERGEVPLEVEGALYFTEPAGALAVTNSHVRFVRRDAILGHSFSIAIPIGEISGAKLGQRRWVRGSGRVIDLTLRRTGLPMRFALLSGGVRRSRSFAAALAAELTEYTRSTEAEPTVAVAADARCCPKGASSWRATLRLEPSDVQGGLHPYKSCPTKGRRSTSSCFAYQVSRRSSSSG